MTPWKIKRSFTVYLFIVLILAYLFVVVGSQTIPSFVKGGKLNLDQFSTSQKIINLSGEWEFYWDYLITPENFNNKIAPEYATIPSSWIRVHRDKQSYSRIGKATYRLRLHHSWSGQKLGLKLGQINSSYELYADNQLIARVGSFNTGDDANLQIKPQTVYFTPMSSNTELTLLVSNSSKSFSGGIVEKLFLGKKDDIDQFAMQNLIWDASGIGGRLLLAFFFLGIFLIRKNIGCLIFSLLNLALSLRVSCLNELLLLKFFPDLTIESFQRIHVMASYLIGPLLFMSIWSFFQYTRMSKHLDFKLFGKFSALKLTQNVYITAPLFVLLEILFYTFSSNSLFQHSTGLFVPLTIFYFLFPLWVIFQVYKPKREVNTFLLMYFFIVILAVAEIINLTQSFHQIDFYPFFFFYHLGIHFDYIQTSIPQQMLLYFILLSLSLYFIKIFLTKPEETHSSQILQNLELTDQRIGELIRFFIAGKGINPREEEIIFWAVKNFSYEEIASKCFISKNTVKFHLRNIYRKTGATNKLDLMKLIYNPRISGK